jgi:3-hydroxyisobutyrate dehydrogenase-like beta-hydroxyacid dehydrogenase
MIGGPSACIDCVEPILRSYADSMIRTGDVGSALTIKLVNNVLFAADAQLVGAAVAVGRALNVDPGSLLSA